MLQHFHNSISYVPSSTNAQSIKEGSKGKHALPQLSADRNPGKQQGDGAGNSLLIPAGTAHGSSTSHPDSEAKLCMTTALNTVGYASPHNQLGRPCIRTRCISTLITSIQWAHGTKTLAQHQQKNPGPTKHLIYTLHQTAPARSHCIQHQGKLPARPASYPAHTAEKTFACRLPAPIIMAKPHGIGNRTW
ncbi:hypothetical protein Nepgr_021437 [Nepenthes gracilis]|uniref:Uncharacterized protein n=1 Tax=Nepenthes gracilis TaxID=150966 RepID=A0AAD3T0Y6_NEPGR|nr:hypothetical protein Nepgr_021437 [Nepenthes gracilis]